MNSLRGLVARSKEVAKRLCNGIDSDVESCNTSMRYVSFSTFKGELQSYPTRLDREISRHINS